GARPRSRGRCDARLRHGGARRPGARYGPRRLRSRRRRALCGGNGPPRTGLSDTDFTWVDGERLIRFAPGAAGQAVDLLAGRGFERYALLTTRRSAAQAPALAQGAGEVLEVPDAPVPDAAAAVRESVGGRA